MKYESQVISFKQLYHHGRREGGGAAVPITSHPGTTEKQVQTRDCLDPWNYLEISAEGMVKPCCIQPPIESILTAEPGRNSNPFRELRDSLLGGKLTPACAACHIRSMVPAAVLQQKVRALAGMRALEVDLRAPSMLKHIRIDISQECNLRCVYCAVSQPNYVGVHMADDIFDKALAIIPKGRNIATVDLNGHGETTFHPRWLDFAKRVQDTGANTTLLSNFAKVFSDAEVAVLARMTVIQISMDTVDETLLRDIRRKVSLETIVGNIRKIRDCAKANGLAPVWSISCGIYDKNVYSLGDLATFVVHNGFKSVTFWNLVEHPTPAHAKIPVCALGSLAGEERDRAVSYAKGIVDYLRRSGVFVEVAGDFLMHPADGHVVASKQDGALLNTG